MVRPRLLFTMAMTACALSACAPPGMTPVQTAGDPFSRYPQTSDKRYAPAPTASAWPWRIGQYVVYKRRTATGIVTLEEVRVVGADSCGFWIERVIHEASRHSWLFCVRGQPASDDPHRLEALGALFEHRNRDVVTVADFRVQAEDRAQYDWFLRLVLSLVGRDLPREDVATPAGTFEQAAKLTELEGVVETTRWTHPAVPLGGIIKEVTPAYERTLVEFGTSARSNEPVYPWLQYGSSPTLTTARDLELAQRAFRDVNRTGPVWLGLRFGYGGLGTPSDLGLAYGVGITYGVRAARAFDAVIDVAIAGDAPSPENPILTEDLLLATAGARWFPLGRTRISRFGMVRHAWLYVQGDLGYAQLERWRPDSDSSTVGRGIVAGARVGLIGAQGRDWTLAIELHDHLALLNADEGLRHSLGVQVALQLFTRPLSYALPW